MSCVLLPIATLLLTAPFAVSQALVQLEPALDWDDQTTNDDASVWYLRVQNATDGCHEVCTDAMNISTTRSSHSLSGENCTGSFRTECGGTFPLDLRSNTELVFDVRAPAGQEILIRGDEDNAVAIEFEANADCSDSPNRGSQWFSSSGIKAKATGSSTSDLSDTYNGIESIVAINGGCGIYTRLQFSGGDDKGERIEASVSQIRWSVSYDASQTAEGPLVYSYGTESFKSGISGATTELAPAVAPTEGEPTDSLSTSASQRLALGISFLSFLGAICAHVLSL